MNGKIKIPHPSEVLYGRGVSLACALDGEIAADQLHGMFAGDTRVLSSYRLGIVGGQWQLLSRERSGFSARRWSFQNQRFRSIGCQVPEGTLLLRLERRVAGALRDELHLRSFLDRPLKARLTLRIDADFADIFQVKEQSIPPRLNLLRAPAPGGLLFEHRHAAFQRGLRVRFQAEGSILAHLGTLVVFDLALPARGEWRCRLEALPVIDNRELPFAEDAQAVNAAQATSVCVSCPEPLAGAFRRSQVDLRSLAVPQDNAPPYVAAGVPWFFTLFGRDSLIAALLSSLDGTWAIEGALSALGRRQAHEQDDWRDAEPGKLPHEIRCGELAHDNVIPHRAYYGTHDTQALYCLALWQVWRWTGDRRLLDAHWETANSALRWCDRYGDQDGDGFQEYATRSRQGYYNQGWKDAGDAVVHADGRLAELPLATVELQGYLFAARRAMAELWEAQGGTKQAAELRREADELRRAVEERFWMEEEGFYAFALNGRKEAVRSISSNPGHLLWCGLPSLERAACVADRLLAPDMFSGWGLRTLSSMNPAYNPLSYQLGSVWPFDTAIAAAGLRRYGRFAAGDTLIRAVLESAAAFEHERLPELFCGIDRSLGPPLPYAKANVPQAWSAAAPILAAALFLGLVPDAPHGRCYLSPRLPDWLPRLAVRGIAIGAGRLDVVIARRKSETVVEDLSSQGIEAVTAAVEAPLWGEISPA